MKKSIKYIIFLASALALATGAASCSDDLAAAPAEMPEGGVGTGRWNNPMTAYQALIGSINEEVNPAWVRGYIVGIVNVDITNVLSERTAVFEGPFNVATNMLIAMSPDERDWEKCATVQLSAGAARDALNLVDNPGNLGKLVCVRGETGSKYCSVYGVRDCKDFNWGDMGREEIDLGEIDGSFYQDFEATTSFESYAAQGWRKLMAMGGLDGWYIRNFGGTNYITVSAYKGTDNGGPYVNWLITPAIEMDKLTEKTLEFSTMAAYKADNSVLEVFVMDGDDPFTAKCHLLQVPIATPPASGGSTYSDWMPSGKIDLSAFTGTIHIGWRYYSAHGGNNGSTTYCLDNINVGNAPAPAK